MARETKEIVKKEDSFDLLEIRVGKVINVDLEPTAHKKSYKIKVDFGKFGIRQTVGRFTSHQAKELINQTVIGVLNFEEVKIGETISEFLLLGAQYPKADSGEATILTTLSNVKIGGKIF